jgi:2'-5' RNA ligase
LSYAVTETASRRLFFALWPGARLTERLTDLQRSWQALVTGRWLPPEQLHVTLVFLGQVTAERLPELKVLATRVVAPAVALTLERIEAWRGSRVLCLTPAETHASLEILVKELAAGLASAGFTLETRPFRAHLTLARQVRATERPMNLSSPIRLEAKSFSLAESRFTTGGSTYARLASWPLHREDCQSQGVSPWGAMR